MKRAYPDKLLDASLILEEIGSLKAAGFSSMPAFTEKVNALKNTLYQPPLWIRVALFIATWLGGGFCLSWLGLLHFTLFEELLNTEVAVLVSCVMGGGISFLMCRHVIEGKNHYCSGVDDALAVSTLFFIGGAFFMIREILQLPPFQWYSLILAAGVAAWFSAYFLDRFMAIIAVALLLYGLYSLVLVTPLGMLILPFVYFLAGVAIWLFQHRIKRKKIPYYETLLDFVEVCSLALMVLSVQFVVVEAAFFHLMNAVGRLPYSLMFKLLSLVVPGGILIFGWRQKNRAMLWVGYLGLMFGLFSLGTTQLHWSMEGALVCIGGLSASIGFFLYKQLKTSRLPGFDLDESASAHFLQDALSTVIQTSVTTDRPDPKTQPKFGGGDFGGAGASSDF